MQLSPQNATLIAGVDVSKAELVVALHLQAGVSRLANNDAAIRAWLRTLPAGSVLAMEATGGLQCLLAQLAHEHGMRVFVLNARDVHHYAKALGSRGKTDRLDAAVIARYAAEHHTSLRQWQPARPALQQLQALLHRRWLLTRQRVALRLSLADVPSLQPLAQHLQQQFELALQEIDRQLVQLVAADKPLSQGVARLRTICGFGLQASALLGSLLSRIPFANVDALVAFSGLDPRPCDSGAHRGKRRLSKRGPAVLRRAMYLSALAACRSKALGPMYQALKARGFAPTQALVILARKLLRVAWAVWNSGQPFQASRMGASVNT